MPDNARQTSAFLLFLGLAYGGIWGLFDLGKWLAVPFSMDLQTPGGAYYLVGAAVPSLSALVSVLAIEKRGGLRRLLTRSLGWRFSPLWYLLAAATPFAVNGLNALIAVTFLGG